MGNVAGLAHILIAARLRAPFVARRPPATCPPLPLSLSLLHTRKLPGPHGLAALAGSAPFYAIFKQIACRIFVTFCQAAAGRETGGKEREEGERSRENYVCAPQRGSTSCLIELHHQSLHTLNDVLSQQPRQQETEREKKREKEREKKQVKIFIKVKIVTQTADRVEERGQRGREGQQGSRYFSYFFSQLFLARFELAAFFFFVGVRARFFFFYLFTVYDFDTPHTHI